MPGFLAAKPHEVADNLARTTTPPDLTGVTLRLFGFGYTAPGSPQKQLGQSQRVALTTTWQAILALSHPAAVTVVPFPRTLPGPNAPFTTVPTKLDEPRPPSFCSGTAAVYDNTSPLGFQEETAVLLNPDAARTTAEKVAVQLRGHPERSAIVTGTTADYERGDLAGQVRTATARANVVAELIRNAGVPATQTQVSGVRASAKSYFSRSAVV